MRWYVLWPVTLLLPLWTVLGRPAMGGEVGWMVVVSLLVFAPILLVGLATSSGLILARPRDRRRQYLWLDTGLLAVLAICVFGYTFFLPDSNDVEDLPSIAAEVFSSLSLDTTSTLAFGFLAAGGFVLLVLFVEALVTCITLNRAAKAQQPQVVG